MKAKRQWVCIASVLILLLMIEVVSYGSDYYVDGTSGKDEDGPLRGSRAQPWKSINYALDHITGTATTKHSVFVAEGVYAENVVVGPYESIYGGCNPTTWAREPATNLTTIRAPAAGSVVVLGDESVVDGFTLRNGNRDYGGGIYCQNVTATISNCHITQNQASQDGSAIYVKAGDVNIVSNLVEQNANVPPFFGIPQCAIRIDGGSATLRYNTIQDNSSGKAIGARDAAVHLQGDRILRNQGYGVYTQGGTLTASDCVIGENSGVGIEMGKGSLNQCVVCLNASEILSWEGVLIEGSVVCQSRRREAIQGTVNLRDSIVVSNCSSPSEASCAFWDGTSLRNNFFVNNGRITIRPPMIATNNTLVMNTCGYYGGGYGFSGEVRITNDILWDNGDDLALGDSSNVTYCNISDGDLVGLNGNISVDPGFVGQVGTGRMSQVKYDRQNCRTVLIDTAANYRRGALARTFLWTSDTAFYVERNTETEITVYGDVTQVASAGFEYTIMDYRLQPLSLCIDVGTNVDASPYDFEGDSRPLLGRIADVVDIGADEYNSEGPLPCRTYPIGDLNEDCVVDMRDLAILLSHWLESTLED